MKPSSRIRPTTRQSGYALILMVLALMGIGGVVITGFTQGAKQDTEHQRYLHNQRILEEARLALLQYVYDYPVNNPDRGPGRLPCPDTNNSGTPNNVFNCISGNAMVGRFPWDAADLNFYDVRDSSGERLWYAVSQNFASSISPLASDVINSDTQGTITIEDRSGAILYDGATSGVAAVIITPGPAIDRNGVKQDRAAGPNAAANYLDLFGTVDNANFVNGTADGFVTGPILNPVDGSLVVNDQMIVITAAEVIAMAEKATLQAYREALEVYLNRPGFGRYPWLDPYDSDDGLATYDAQINPAPPAPIIGRVPSTFGNYFVAAPPSDTEPIVSEMTIELNIDGHLLEVRVPASAALKAHFENTTGDLVAPFNSGATFTGWVWDGSPTKTPTFLEDGWEACPYVTGTEEDCNLDAGGNFVGGSSSPMWLKVRKISFSFSGASPFVFPFGDRVDPDPITGVTYVPPSATSHAYVEAEYDGAYITGSVVAWEEDQEFQSLHDIYPALNVGSLTYDTGDSVTVGIRYYPELPLWTLANGWHDMLQAAYSSELRPGGDNVCTPGVDCLTLQDVSGITNNKRALLVLSGGVDDDPLNTNLTDVAGVSPYYADDLNQIFEDENNDLDRVFDNRPTTGLANDVIFQLE